MDSDVPESPPPTHLNTGDTQPPIGQDDGMEDRHLWDVQHPDLSVLHSMPSEEPFSHEGNALFELLERSKQQQASASTLRRATNDNAAGVQWQLPPPPLPPTGRVTSSSNTMATAVLPAPPTTTGRISRAPMSAPPPRPAGTSTTPVSPFSPSYSDTRRYTDFSAGSSSSARDDKGKSIIIERPPPQPSRVPSIRQVHWHLFDHNAPITGEATARNRTSGDHGRLVHRTERIDSNQNVRQETIRGGAVNNPWLSSNQIRTEMESNHEFSIAGQRGFTDNQQGLQNPVLYDDINPNWPSGLQCSDIGNDLLRDGDMGEFPSAGHGNVDLSRTLGHPRPTNATRRDFVHDHDEMQHGGAGGPSPGQALVNPYWSSGHPDEAINLAEVNNQQTIADPGHGFNNPLLYSIPMHPHCDSCNVLRQATHSDGIETRVIEVHLTESGLFHTVASVMYAPDGNLTVPEFMSDHFFQSFLVVESFLGDYFKYQEELNRSLVQDDISNYYTALRLQWLFDEQETAPQPVEPVESTVEPVEALPETSPKASESTTPTKSTSENTASPRVNESTGATVPFQRSNITEQRRRTGRMKLQDIQEFMHFPLAEAADKLQVCSTVLKKISRKYGIKRWPYRKIKAIDRTIAGLERTRDQNANVPDERLEAEIRRQKEMRERLLNGKNSRP